jgi:hypothetical protein
MIDDILSIVSKDKSAMIVDAASLRDLENVQKQMTERGFSLIPKGYIDFLLKHNGFAWSDIAFFGTREISENGTNFVLKDIVSKNEEFIKRNKEIFDDVKKYVFLGDSGESVYVYNTKNQRYEVMDFQSRDVRDYFDSFDALFTDIVSEWV